MIKILFPPGCYGTYLTRCLYNYTNLRTGAYTDFTFDDTGSNHAHRTNVDAASKIRCHHHLKLSISDSDQLITILPLHNHRLDYYNNQYHKQNNSSLTDHILTQISIDNINTKLSSGWHYTESLTTAPVWILRELLSLSITDCFDSGYSVKDYDVPSAKLAVTTEDIIVNINESLHKICQALGLVINVTAENILTNHNNFISKQRYHNSQLKCNTWVDATINSTAVLNNPCQTIFDEAYTQNIFRTQGYEIKCAGLNIMPSTSVEMKELIYKL